MYLLMHNNVDGYPSVWGEFQEKPSQDEIVEFLSQYSWSEEEIKTAANDLIKSGEAHIYDGSCTQFNLTKI